MESTVPQPRAETIWKRGIIPSIPFIFGLIGHIFLIGFYIAILVGVFLFVRFQGNQPWIESAIFTAILLVLWASFGLGMGLGLFQGMILGGRL